MLVPFRLNSLPGLLLAALPPVAVGGFTLALLSFVGGGAQVWRMAGVTGTYSVWMATGVLGVTAVLSALLCMGPTGKHAPLVVLVGLATLPWMLGIAGSQEAMRRLLETLPEGRHGDAVQMLVTGTGEAMVTRLVGAWMSAALLSAVALGLVLLHRRARLSGEHTGRLLGAGLGVALGGIALLVALEAHQLFELLTSLATHPPEARAGLLTASALSITHLHALRATLLGVLAVLALALVGWQFLQRPEAITQWAGSLMLGVIAASVVILDARPLQLAAREASRAEDPSRPLPVLMHQVLTETLGALPPTSPLTAPALLRRP
jgi:hypothetical protein